MQVVCVTMFDAKSPTAFSGGHDLYLIQSLEDALGSMEYIGPLEQTRVQSWILRAKLRFYGDLLGKSYWPSRDKLILKHYARQIHRELAAMNVDVVFSPMSRGSQPIAYVDCKQPIVIWTDASFAGVIDFYPLHRKDYLCKETYRHGMANERAALRRCRLAIYSSDWAAQTAVEHHGIDPEKVKVVPFGANLTCRRTLDDINRMIASRSTETCRLLFLAKAWRRKGGDVALDVAKRLVERGVHVQLTTLGSELPDNITLPDYVNAIGYIEKSTEDGKRRINTLIAESHFLILPTVADCTPMVFPEANSFGVPCVSTDVGGIKTMIRDDINGKTFSIDADPDEWCDYIEAVFADRSRYEELARSSFNEYVTRLNWDVSAQKVKQLMESLL